MMPDLPWRRGAILISQAAAAAVAEVQAAAMEHGAHMGRAGVTVSLRAQARDLAGSAVARDQIRSRAFESAADDVAWGRPPLADWRLFAIDALPAPEADRAPLRAAAAQPVSEDAAHRLAREVEHRALSSDDTVDAVRSLAVDLAAEAQMQEMLWDDPRIAAAPEVRALMRASAAVLRRRAEELDTPIRPAPKPQASPVRAPARRVSGWRRLFAAR